MRVVSEGKLHIKQNMPKSNTSTAMNKIPQFTFGEYIHLCDSAYLVSVLPQVEKNLTLDLSLTNTHQQLCSVSKSPVLAERRSHGFECKNRSFFNQMHGDFFGDKAITKVHKLWDKHEKYCHSELRIFEMQTAFKWTMAKTQVCSLDSIL